MHHRYEFAHLSTLLTKYFRTGRMKKTPFGSFFAYFFAKIQQNAPVLCYNDTEILFFVGSEEVYEYFTIPQKSYIVS